MPRTVAPKLATVKSNAKTKGMAAINPPSSTQENKQIPRKISGVPNAAAMKAPVAAVKATMTAKQPKAESPEDEEEVGHEEEEKEDEGEEEEEEEEAPAAMEEEAPVMEDNEIGKAGATAMKAPPKQRATKKSKNEQVAPRGKKAANELYSAIAQESGNRVQDVEKVLQGLRKVGARLLKKNQVFHMPGMVRFAMKVVPARAQSTKTILGKKILLKAKPITKKLTTSTLKQFIDMTLNG
jgi:hypothetical protein